MKNKGLEIGMYSVLGDRASQQDAGVYKWNKTLMMAVVCDGMGGMEGGDQASKIGVETLADLMEKQPPSSVREADQWLMAAFSEADRRIAFLTDEAGNTIYAGSTVVAVIISDGWMQWGSVGDSSIYILRNGEITILTRMHNYNLQLEEMFRIGEIDEESKIRESVRGEALISYLGIGGIPLVDTSRLPISLQKEDVILLCSDGLYKALEDEQIQVIIEESGGNMDIAARRLCEEACRLSVRKQDNTTVIAIRYMGSSSMETAEGKA